MFQGWLLRVGLTMSASPLSDQTRLDLTISDLARVHGCTSDTIGRIVRRRGLAGTIRSSAVHDHDAIAAHYAAGALTVVSAQPSLMDMALIGLVSPQGRCPPDGAILRARQRIERRDSMGRRAMRADRSMSSAKSPSRSTGVSHVTR